jgi:uncharacterized protein YukE
MWVSANFSELDNLQQSVGRTAAGIDGEHQDWTAQVRELMGAWPDSAGVTFEEVDRAAMAFAQVNNEFLTMLGIKVADANQIYQDTLQSVRADVASLA